MSTITNSQSSIDLILNQIPENVFTDNDFDMNKYPSEIFLLEDTSIPVFAISDKTGYDKAVAYLKATKKHENVTSSSAVIITKSWFSGVNSIKASTIYLATYTNSISLNAIGGGKTEDVAYIHAVDLKTVDDINFKI